MTGRTHDLAAITILVAYIAYQPLIKMSLATGVTAVAANQIGAFLPDIDQPTASLWRKIPAGSILGRIVSPLLGSHRMLSHSIAGMALTYWGLGYLLDYMHSFLLVDMNVVRWAFMLGFFSHLVMDTITKVGVPWLFPIPVRFGFPPEKMFRVSTGTFMETIVVFTLLLCLNGYLIYVNYSKMIDFVRHYITV